MRINLTFAELHTPLFHGGRNFGLKLDNNKFSGITLIYDRTEKELWITHNNKTAIIPTSNVVSMTPEEQPIQEAVAKAIPISMPAAAPGKFQANLSAQVHTPTSHVFEKKK